MGERRQGIADLVVALSHPIGAAARPAPSAAPAAYKRGIALAKQPRLGDPFSHELGSHALGALAAGPDRQWGLRGQPRLPVHHMHTIGQGLAQLECLLGRQNGNVWERARSRAHAECSNANAG